MYWGYYWGMNLFWWIFWALVVAFLAYWGLRPTGGRHRDEAIELLRAKYAAGEIDDLEYQRRRAVLMDDRRRSPSATEPAARGRTSA